MLENLPQVSRQKRGADAPKTVPSLTPLQQATRRLFMNDPPQEVTVQVAGEPLPLMVLMIPLQHQANRPT